MASPLPLGASRIYHRAIDGTIPYFRSEEGMQEEGRLPANADPSELLAQGYVEADRDSFLEARRRLDPLRPTPERPSQINFHGPAGRAGVGYDSEGAMDAALASLADGGGAAPESMEIQRQNEPQDVDYLADSFDGAYAPGLARQQSALDAAIMGRKPVPVPAKGVGTGNRRPVYDVQNVPSTVPLASRLGGEPLPGPQRVAASPETTPQQGRTFGEADTLEDAQKRERLLRGLGGIAGSTSKIGYLIAGAKPPGENAGGRTLTRDADTQVRDYLTRKQQGEADKASALKMAESDPTSPASKNFQALVSRAFGSVYTPEQIQGMTAADAPLVSKYGEMVRTLEDRAAGRAADMGAQQAQLTARATEADKQRAFEGKQGAANRANAREIAGMRQGSTGGKADEAFQRRMSERNVGGFEIDPANPPTAEGAKRMASAVDAREQIRGSLDRLEQLFNEYGTEMGGGSAQSGMEAELGNITTQLRLFNQMGVPNLNDYTELAKQIPQTAGVGAWFTREGTIRPKFKTLKEQLDRAVASTAQAYKFRPAGGAPMGRQAPTAGTAPRRKRDAEGRVWEEQPDGSARLVL